MLIPNKGMHLHARTQDDVEYNEVIQDLAEECGKYGVVTKVLVPRPPVPAQAPAVFGSNNYGKVRGLCLCRLSRYHCDGVKLHACMACRFPAMQHCVTVLRCTSPSGQGLKDCQ